ncbi:hypothetical protein MFIFM68171_09369 [Madurella fahalii]|uniref:Uncharacterized protein n=1 Tax=Madurella fahalii TaxID=1157608 RepID=A0ABQ0GN28_9PEZI
MASDTSVPVDVAASDDTNAIQGLNAQFPLAHYETGVLTRENEKLREKVAELVETVDCYRKITDDKSLECVDLKRRLQNLEQQLAPANQASGWALGSLFLKPRDSQRPNNEEVVELRMTVVKYENAIRQLKNETHQLREKATRQAEHIRIQTSRFSRELDELRNNAFLIKAPTMSDTEIVAKWKALGFSIRQFISNYVLGSLTLPKAQQLAQAEPFRWLPKAAKTLQLHFLRHAALESLIWHFLCFQIFDLHSRFWAGEAGEVLGREYDRIRGSIVGSGQLWSSEFPTIAQFHHWRALTEHFISLPSTPDQRTLNEHRVAHSMIDILGHIITDQTIDTQSMLHDGLEIVRNAAELDKIFRTSKADFHVFITRVKLPLLSPPSFGFRFDPETMKLTENVPFVGRYRSTNQGMIVDLAISPGILKAGNSAGENYESERVLVKLHALCNLQEMLEHWGEPQEEMKDGRRQQAGRNEETVRVKEEESCTDNDVDMISFHAVPHEN